MPSRTLPIPVLVPMNRDAVPVRIAPAAHPAEPRTHLRVLLADDRSRTRRALGALLSTYPGLEVVGEAKDGEAALAATERWQPDVVLLDVYLPGVDGIAVARRMKRRWPNMRVVAHSLAIERSEEMLAAGADSFVAKGSPTEELLGAILSPQLRNSWERCGDSSAAPNMPSLKGSIAPIVRGRPSDPDDTDGAWAAATREDASVG